MSSLPYYATTFGKSSGFLFPGWGFDFSHSTATHAVQLRRQRGILPVMPRASVSKNRAWSSSGWAAFESLLMHSLAWNLWAGLDQGGLSHIICVLTAFCQRLLIPPRRIPCLGAPLPKPGGQGSLHSMRNGADNLKTATLRHHRPRKQRTV